MSTDPQQTFDFLVDKLLFKLQVTLSADKAAVDSVVQRIMESIREKDCAGGKEPANVYSGHGRGVYLMTQLMDEVKFLKNGTEIHMIKR